MRANKSRLLLVWYTVLFLTAADLAVLGLCHYMTGVYRRAVWDDFNTGARQWQAVENVPYADIINRFGKVNQISPRLAAAVIEAESSFQPRAVSPAGAYGLMQVIPGTWQYVNNRLSICQNRHGGPCTTACYFQPELNIGIGTAYLSELTDRFRGNAVLALAAYNAGPGAVERYGGVPPYSETQDYVKRVIDYWYQRQGKVKPVYDVAASRWEKGQQFAWLLFGMSVGLLIMLVRHMNRRYGSWRWR